MYTISALQAIVLCPALIRDYYPQNQRSEGLAHPSLDSILAKRDICSSIGHYVRAGRISRLS